MITRLMQLRGLIIHDNVRGEILAPTSLTPERLFLVPLDDLFLFQHLSYTDR